MKNDNWEGLESQLFKWKEWDGEPSCMTYYNPVLKVQIGEHPPGTKFDDATILFDKSVLQLNRYGPMKDGHAPVVYTAEYKLKLSIAEVLAEPKI